MAFHGYSIDSNDRGSIWKSRRSRFKWNQPIFEILILRAVFRAKPSRTSSFCRHCGHCPNQLYTVKSFIFSRLPVCRYGVSGYRGGLWDTLSALLNSYQLWYYFFKARAQDGIDHSDFFSFFLKSESKNPSNFKISHARLQNHFGGPNKAFLEIRKFCQIWRFDHQFSIPVWARALTFCRSAQLNIKGFF